MNDTKLDELLELAAKRALLEAELEQIRTRMHELRGELEGPRALPPVRQRKQPAAAKTNGTQSRRDQILALMRRSKKDWNAVELAAKLSCETNAAASVLTKLYTEGVVVRISRGRYEVA